MDVDAARTSAEAQVDCVVEEGFALQACADTRSREQIHRALLEHAGADGLEDVLAAAALEHDGVDAAQVEQVGKQEARGARADDADLRAHARV